MRSNVARLVATAPLRTIRTSDLAKVYAHPRAEARALERQGLLHRLAHGFYCAVPAEHDPARWQPTIEATAADIATTIYGDRVLVLTWLTAARVQRVLPRAIDVAFVAVPTQRRPLQLLDRAGQVWFVTRAVRDLGGSGDGRSGLMEMVVRPAHDGLDIAVCNRDRVTPLGT